MRARRKRVTVTFAALMGLLIVCFITTIYVTNHKTEKAIEEMLLSQASESVKMRSDILSNLSYTSRNILANCIYNAELNAILKNTVAYDRRAAKTVGEKLRNFSLYHLNDLNMRVTIFDLNGNTYTNWQRGGDFYDEIMSTQQVREAIGEKGSFFFLSHPYWYADTDLCDERIDVLTLGNVIVDQHLSKPIGILLVSVEEASLL